MKVNSLKVIAAAVAFSSLACGIDDDPIAPPLTEIEQSVAVRIQPPTALRTLDTWNFWTLPVDVTFVVRSEGEAEGGTGGHDGDGHSHAGAPVLSDGRLAVVGVLSPSLVGEEGVLVGAVDVGGMMVQLRVSDAESIWELEHDGELHEHLANDDQSHMSVEVFDSATHHHAHGGPTVSHCEVVLVAVPEGGGDPMEFGLNPVQSAHGFRYEANAALPNGVYDLHVEIEPPTFLRMGEVRNMWTSHAEVEFHDFVLDATFEGGLVGEAIWTGADADSLKVSLRAGSVKRYGALGMGLVPLDGDETINFSMRIEDPTSEAHDEPLFGSIVSIAVDNPVTGSISTAILQPMYGDHGFHFGQNVDVRFGHLSGHDDGHAGEDPHGSNESGH